MSTHVIRPIPLVLGASRLSDHTYRVDLGRTVITCTYMWYIEGSDRKILVDAGANAEDYLQHGYPGRIDLQTPEEGLAKIGLTPADIDVVILTHLHFDHYLFVTKFSNAKFILQKAELEYWRNPLPFEAREAMREDALDHIDLQLIEGDYEVAEGVNVLFTPGHTGGNQSVAVGTAKGSAVIDGLCGMHETFNPPDAVKGRLPVIPSMIHVDLQQCFDSLLRIKQTADVIIPLHDVRFSYVDVLP